MTRALTMTPRLRKLALTAHVVSSVGWLGAVLAYLSLAITALTSRDAETVRAAFSSMESIGWLVIVPLSLAALITGLVQSFGTAWGLLRHYWVVAKFLLTIGATTILLLHMPAVSRAAGIAAEAVYGAPTRPHANHATFLVHAGGGLLILLVTTTLSVYKPWGMTEYGRRRLQGRRISRSIPPESTAGRAAEDAEPVGKTWRLFLLLGIAGLILLHLAGGGLRGH